MAVSLSLEQEARVLTCHDAHAASVESALGDTPSASDRMVRISALEAAGREGGQPVELLIAWMHRVITDETVRTLHGDLDLRWPARPDPDDVALVLTLAADPACWYYEIRAALQLTERVLRHHAPTEPLVLGLLALRTRMTDDRLHSSEFFRAKALPWLLRLLAETTPAELADVGFLDTHDRWVPVVTTAVHGATDPAWTAQAMLHLGSPRGGKPSKAWWTRTAELLDDDPELVSLAVELLDAVTIVDTTARDDERDGWDVPDPFLLTPTNELLARGLAWALRLPEPRDQHCEVLGRVVLRSAAMVWVVPAHRMLCPKLASAAVDTLIAVESPASDAQLSSIVGEIRVPALIRRIGPHVGLDSSQVNALVGDLRRRGPLPRPDR